MRQINIGCDLDGVLCDFNRAYRGMLREVTGKDLFNGEVDPPVWAYARHYGYTGEEDALAWQRIMASSNFWSNLGALPGAADFLWALDCQTNLGEPPQTRPRVYFITSRPGVDVQGQTVNWLLNHGIDTPAALIVKTADDKAQIARALSLTHFIDDKPENCLMVKAAVPTCTVFCPPCRYNEMERAWLRTKGVIIGGLSAFLEACGVQEVVQDAA